MLLHAFMMLIGVSECVPASQDLSWLISSAHDSAAKAAVVELLASASVLNNRRLHAFCCEQVHPRAVQLQLRGPSTKSSAAADSATLIFAYLPEARALRVSAAAGTPPTLLEAVSENDSSHNGQYRCRVVMTLCCMR